MFFAMPFTGPAFAPSAADASTLHWVVVTHAILRWRGRLAFYRSTAGILESLQRQEGMMGLSVRARPLGGEAWTVTVWQSEESLGAFVTGKVHMAAMRTANRSLARLETRRGAVTAARVPRSWLEAECFLRGRAP